MNIQPQSAIVSRVSREIDGKGRTVRELLANRKCSIDYYQREYKWQHKQVSELMKIWLQSFWRATRKAMSAAQ